MSGSFSLGSSFTNSSLKSSKEESNSLLASHIKRKARVSSSHNPRATRSPSVPTKAMFNMDRVSLNPEKKHCLNVTTMAGKIAAKITLALEAGKANPAPPVGPALGSKGVNIMQFCKQYNAQTADKQGQIIPVEITVFEDKSFTFILKTPPASFLIKQAAGIQKGSGSPNQSKVGTITRTQLKEIAEIKLPDLNCNNMDAAMKTIEGTAKNMGVTVSD